MDEFSLIEKYLLHKTKAKNRVYDCVLGPGDDGSIVKLHQDFELVSSMDSLVAGRHFPADARPEDIAYRTIAVNISDMAAMGAEPAWCHLSLTLPETDEQWLAAFSKGLFRALDKWQIDLLGGDLCAGPLSLTLHISGVVPDGQAIRRNGAREGDLVFVSGEFGNAAVDLLAWGKTGTTTNSLMLPEPRIALGMALRDIATACIDVSDGLIADLGHIMEASQRFSGENLTAMINVEEVPLGEKLVLWLESENKQSSEVGYKDVNKNKALQWALSAGDDYELCFIVPEDRALDVDKISQRVSIPCRQIGRIESGSGQSSVKCVLEGEEYMLQQTGYQHFRE